MHVDAAAKVTKANARAIHGMRRQRRPAAIIAVAAPTHPRRAPGAIGNPYPAARTMIIPAAIMEGSPAPRIIRMPIPAGGGPLPTAARAVRPPAAIYDGDGGLPAPAVIADVKPTAVRREGIVKVSNGLGLRVNNG